MEKDYGAYPVAVDGRERVDTVQATCAKGGLFFGRAEEQREGRSERDLIGLRTSLEAQVFHIRHLATSHSLRTRQSVAAGPHAPFAHGLSASRSGRRRTRVFHPPERRPIKSHVLQAQILSQILSAAPESSCHTHKHARIRLTVRPKSSREVSRAFCPRRRPGRARLIPLFNLPPPPSSEY